MEKENLKTLKDLKEDWKNSIINESDIQKAVSAPEDSGEHGIEFSMTGELIPLEIVEGDLKQEAIKEIKHFRKNRSSNPDYSKQELNGVEKYIMWKFNTTEEDLK